MATIVTVDEKLAYKEMTADDKKRYENERKQCRIWKQNTFDQNFLSKKDEKKSVIFINFWSFYSLFA